MSINVNDKNIGHATAYAYYKAGGGTMTKAEFTKFMADFGTASQTAVEAAQAALASQNAAQTAATTATNKASEATTAATTATTKAQEAVANAEAAARDASQAMAAESTATAKASEATTAAATATSAATTATTAKDDAVSAKTAAQTAQTGAETAAASVQSSAAQIQTNADDISELKEDLTLVSDALYYKYNGLSWELGNISLSSSGWTYWTTVNNKRIRTPKGQQIYVTKGSVIKLTDYSDAEFFVGMRKDGVYTANGWISSGEFIAPLSGEYVFVVRNKTETDQTDTTALASLFVLEMYGVSEIEKQIEGLDNNITEAEEEIEEEIDSIRPYGLKNPFLIPSGPRFAMHRGYSANAPENTKSAFESAGQAGAWAIETDVHETTDGYFVCFHDNDVERMTDGTGNINEMTLAQVEALTIDAGNHIADYPNEKIPTLKEFLRICKRYGCVAFIEWKYIVHEENMVKEVQDCGMENSVVFLVGAVSTVNRLRLYTNAPCAILGYNNSDDATIINNAASVKNTYADIVQSHLLDSTYTDLAHSKNVPLIVWTVDTTTLADQLFRYGVDVVTSNSIPKFN